MNTLLEKAECLMQMHKQGLLGDEVMPEDANPNLDKSSAENYLYFTLPMSLNYQRNSYTPLAKCKTNIYRQRNAVCILSKGMPCSFF